jgi:hypothetical protein
MGNGIADLDGNGYAVVAHPSRSAVEIMLGHLGYEVHVKHLGIEAFIGESKNGNANELSASNPMADYALGRRLIFMARKLT